MEQARWGWRACLAAGLIAATAPPAFALSVSPPVVELRASAGSRLHGAFVVTNDTEEPSTVTVETEVLSRTGYVQRDPNEWLTVTPSLLELAPGEVGEVTYDVSVPEDARGELAAVVVFVQNLAPQAGGVQMRFGMSVYVSVSGTEELEVRVDSMALRLSEHSAQAWLRIANHGNVHCRPEGSVLVNDPSGRTLGQGQLVRGAPVHPGQQGTFVVSLPDGLRLAQGTYQLVADLTCYAASQVPSRLHVRQVGDIQESGQWASTDPPAVIPDH